METLETFGNIGNTGEGNTKLPRAVPGRYWCFTLNNWKLETLETMETYFKKGDIKYIIGEEVGENGTPHLQGYIECPSKVRPIEKFGLDKNIHWEKCKGNKSQNIKYCSKDGKIHTNIDILKDPLKGLELYKWQTDILNIIKTEPDNRTINWYYGINGCEGKTTLAKHICINNKEALYVNGKGADVKCAIAEMLKKDISPKVVIFGFPRTAEDYCCYSALEEVKDGLFFSGKFESTMCMFNSPHIIVFANFKPDIKKLSKDRWNIINIDENSQSVESDDYDTD